MTENDKMMMAGMIAGRVKSHNKKRLEAAKRLMHWTLDEWSSAVRCALAAKVIKEEEPTPAAMRIENTQFTVGRYYGGMTYNNVHYTYFEPEINGHEPNADGSPYVAWLMVQDDFVEYLLSEEMTQSGKEKS